MKSGRLNRQFVAAATRTILHGGRFLVLDDLLCLRIPFDRALEALGNASQLANGGRAMTHGSGADCGFAADDGFDEVLAMIL